MILYYSKEKEYFLVSQFLGYALSHYGVSLVRKGECELVKTEKKVITDLREVFDLFSGMCIFRSHYVEDTLFYTQYVSTLHQYYNAHPLDDNRDKDQDELIRDSVEYEKKAHDFVFEQIKDQLINSRIEEQVDFYTFPYTFNDENYGFKIQTSTLFIEEEGKMKEVDMGSSNLVNIIKEGEFIHVEPMLNSRVNEVELEIPRTDKEREPSPNGFWLSDSYNHIIEDLFDLNILKSRI